MKYLVLSLSLAAVGLLVCGVSCMSEETETPRDKHFRADTGDDILAGEGDSVVLHAVGTNGAAPFLYRWDVERQPEGAEPVTLDNETATQITTSPLNVQGRYVFRVVVIDATGQDAYSFVVVNVGPPGTGSTTGLEVSVEGPESIVPGEPGEFRATVDTEGDFTYLWEVVTDDDITFDTPDLATTGFTVPNSGTITVRVTVADETANAAGAAEWTILAAFEGALAVTVSGASGVEVDELIDVSASVSNANGEITYLWTITDGEAELTNADTDTVSIRPTAAGRLAVQVEVTDDFDGETAMAEYVVTVDASTSPLVLRTTGPDILMIDEDGELTVEIEGDEDYDEITYFWEVVAGDATLDAPLTEEPVLSTTASKPETIQVNVKVTAVSATATRIGDADVFVVTITEDRPQAVLTIANFGEIIFELRADVAPKTVANFLHYVDDGFFDGLLIHRIVQNFVVQGGGYKLDENGELEHVEPRDPVPGESDNGLSNVEDTVAMALSGGNADSGTSQWFINIADNSASLDGQNFTVFATVNSNGMKVIEEILEVETEENPFAPEGEISLPVDPIIIESVVRAE